MKQQYYLPLCLAIATAGLCGSAKAQYTRTPGYQTKPVTERIESNWLLNVGVGYGNYYGDMSNYRIRRFEDIGLLRNFVNYNNNYIQEPSFHLSVAKRLMGNTGIGFNFNRTLIQSSDRYIRSNGTLQTSNPNFARSLNFQTDILDAGLSLNLNGFTRGFFAPYLSLGAGISFFDVKGDVFTGPNQNQVYNYAGTQNVNDGTFETNLRNARTETEERYPNKAIYAQALLGFNFQLARTFSLALEADVKYSGSDYLDDLSGTYKTNYPSLQNAYIAKPGPNAVNPITNNRGYNDGVNDFYIQTRVVFRFHIPRYITRSEARKIRTSFNAPVLYPNNYPVNAVDSSAYLNTLNRMKSGNGGITDTASANAGMLTGRRRTDSAAMAKRDSLRADSLSNRNTYNVKMDSAYVNELKALRQEITGLRQAISAATPRSKDSVPVRRVTLKDSLQQSLKSLQEKKRKTPADSLQLRIYQLRLDSIGLVEKYTAKDAGTTKAGNAAVAQQPVAPGTSQPAVPSTIAAGNNSVSREDSLRKVIDSLRNLNTAAAQRQPARTTQSEPAVPRTIRNVRDTITVQQTRQYEQQIAGLTYRSRQAGSDSRQQQKQLDSIRTIAAAIRASDSLKVVHYQNQLARARQLETSTKEAEPRKGLLVRKSDQVKEAEENRRQVEERLRSAQASQQQNIQGARVAAGDTAYIAGLQQQISIRQAQIDSLKSSRKVTDVFSNKNRRIRELEEAQEQQRKEAEEANRLLQYYRSTGPTSYTQPVYDQRDYNRQINDMNNRIRDLQRLQTLSYIQQPVNAVSPVVVSGNNDDKKERERMQSEIDSLRSQLNQLSQAPRKDTVVRMDALAARPVTAGVDTSLQRSLAAANQASIEMSAIQLQLAELSRQMNERRTPAPTSARQADTAARQAVSTTVYFSRGSAVLATLQKAKLSALVKKNGKTETYRLTSSTDNTTGNTAANEALAKKRVATVASYLRTLGIPAGQISTIANASNGEPEAAPDPLARNVSVEVL